MTNSFTEYRTEPNPWRSHDHAPTSLELQRWEDDGGAVLPGAMQPRKRLSQRRASDEQFHCMAKAELAAAE